MNIPNKQQPQQHQQQQQRKPQPVNNNNNSSSSGNKQNPQLQRQKSLQINMIQWEKSINFSAQELDLLQQLEKLDKKIDQNNILTKQKKTQFLQSHKSDLQIQVQKEEDKQEEKINFISIETEKNQIEKQQEEIEQKNKNVVSQIKEIKFQNSKFLTFLNDILGDLEDIKSKFEDLQSNKTQLIDKISEFYDQSQKIIDQEKSLLTLQQILKENVQYYIQADDMERELQEISFDIGQRQVFENLLQRFLSEINDGIIFFESNEKFKNAEQYLEHYIKLKAKILALIKAFLFKIFNKEFAFINQYLNNITSKQWEELFLNSYSDFIQFTDPQNEHVQVMNYVNYDRCLFLSIIYPQFQHIFSANHQKKFMELQITDTQQFQLNQVLKNLISYIENSSFKDQEISQIYTDVFINYLTYCRASLHKEIQGQLNQLYQNYLQKQIKEKSQYKNKQLHFLENFMHFIFEIITCEFLYTDYTFNYTNQITIDMLKSHWMKILDSYYDFIRPILIKQIGIESIFHTLDTIKNYHQFYALTFTKCHQQDPYYKELKLTKIRPETFATLEQMFTKFAEKLKQDCMHKLIQQSQIYIQENITNFNVNNYLKNKQLVIRKFESIENSQQKDFYPVVQSASSTLKMLKTRIETSIFQQMACEIVNSTIQQLFQVAEKFQEKFDAFLFLAKNLIFLSETIITLNMDFLVNQQEFDFSDTKMLLNDIVSGNIPYTFNLGDLVQADKLWDYASSFFNFLYRGMPKLNDMTIDIKKDIIYQIKNVLNNMNKDITFIISKNLIDFIRKHQQLTEIQNQNNQKKEKILNPEKQQDQEESEQQQNEQQQQQDLQLNPDQKKAMQEIQKEEQKVEEDIKLLLSNEIVKKTYILFLENIKEMSLIMYQKLQNYVEKTLFDQLIHHIFEIQQNSLSLLSQFYIIVAKYYPEENYEHFQFIAQQDLRKELSQIIQIQQN